MKIREAAAADAQDMSDVLEELVSAGKRSNRADREFVLSRYITDPNRIRCSVALDEDGTILGFQSLKWAREGNPYDTPVGWGIIGTHVRPSAARRGVGRALFAASETAARDAGLTEIEAFIGSDNQAALIYYEAMGFGAYRWPDGVVAKVLRL